MASENQGLHLSTSGVCYFRQALALDERRVKFLPEYVHGGANLSQAGGDDTESDSLSLPSVKEVWFVGNHADMCARNISHVINIIYLLPYSGGRNSAESDVNLFGMPLFWMKHEAMMADLRFNPEGLKWRWGWKDMPVTVVTKVPKICWLLEYWPVLQLNYSDAASQSRYVLKPLVPPALRLPS